MSPPGDQRAKSEAKERKSPFAFARSHPASHLEVEGSLPLRLSVAQGGLGLELSRPTTFGVVTVEELDIALLGVRYPVDLSLGVKQFRSRRGALRHAVVCIDLDRLGSMWGEELGQLFGVVPSVRIRPTYDAGNGAEENDVRQSPSALSVSIAVEKGALAFDLVLTSGVSPRFVVDAPRAAGLLRAPDKMSPLALALRAVDLGLTTLGKGLDGARRTGRAVELAGLAHAVSLAVLPALGCRLPQVQRQVVREVRVTRRGLVMSLGENDVPLAATRRALRIAGFADFVREADEFLVAGESSSSRRAFLEALEKAPGHPEILQELAELDLAVGDRNESAAAFLNELAGQSSLAIERSGRARLHLSLAAALEATGRNGSAREEMRKALELEIDSVLAATLACELFEAVPAEMRDQSLLDEAVSRAPFLSRPHRLRFFEGVRIGKLPLALAAGQQLEALATSVEARASVCLQVGVALVECGELESGKSWLEKALRQTPDEPDAMVALASCFEQSGAVLRAAELLQVAVRRYEETLPELLDKDAEDKIRGIREKSASARLQLAKSLQAQEATAHEVLSALGPIETRCRQGTNARLMEVEILHGEGRPGPRDRTISRLIEGVELGWVARGPWEERLMSLLESSENAELSGFAKRVLGETSHRRSDT